MKTKLLKTLRGMGKAGFILTVVLCFTTLCGCAGEVADSSASVRENNPGEGVSVHELGTFEGLSAETEKRILQDYFDVYFKAGQPDASFNDIWVGRYCGTYNGWVVVNIFHPWGRVQTFLTIEIAGIKVYDGDSTTPPVLWKDGQLYLDMQEAYDQGVLTLENLRSIAKYSPY